MEVSPYRVSESTSSPPSSEVCIKTDSSQNKIQNKIQNHYGKNSCGYLMCVMLYFYLKNARIPVCTLFCSITWCIPRENKSYCWNISTVKRRMFVSGGMSITSHIAEMVMTLSVLGFDRYTPIVDTNDKSRQIKLGWALLRVVVVLVPELLFLYLGGVFRPRLKLLVLLGRKRFL